MAFSWKKARNRQLKKLKTRERIMIKRGRNKDVVRLKRRIENYGSP